MTTQNPQLGPGDDSPLCASCRYSLLGLETSRCPECGREFDPARAETYTTLSRLRRQARGAFLAILLTYVAMSLLLWYVSGFPLLVTTAVALPLLPVASRKRAPQLLGLAITWLLVLLIVIFYLVEWYASLHPQYDGYVGHVLAAALAGLVGPAIVGLLVGALLGLPSEGDRDVPAKVR